MAEVIVNIKANTGQATNQVENLDTSLNSADNAAQKLNKDLGKAADGTKKLAQENNNLGNTIKGQEARIKTLDGAINLVGGSIEVLTGGIVALGLASEEDAAAFEKMALGAIALADGSKRIFDGFKSLSEARQTYLEIQQAATTAEEADAAATAANTAAQTANATAITANVVATEAQAVANYANAASKVKLIKSLEGTSVATKTLNTFISIQNKLSMTAALLVEKQGYAIASLGKEIKLLLGAPLGWFALIGAITAGVIALTNMGREQAILNKQLKDANKIIGDINGAYAKAAITQEQQLKILTDNVEQRGLETKAIKDLKKEYPGFEAFLTRENKLNAEGIAFLKTKIQLRKAEAALALINQKQVEEEINLQNQIADIRADEGYTTRGARLVAQAREDSRKRLELLNTEEQKYLTLLDQAIQSESTYAGVIGTTTNELQKKFDTIPPYINAVKEEVEILIEAMGGLEKVVTGPIAKAFDDFNTQMEKSMRLTYELKNATKETTVEIPPVWQQYLNLIGEYNKTFVEGQVEFFRSDLGEAVGAGLQAAVNLARTIRETIDDSTEEGFEQAKKARIAETRIASIQAAFSAYGGVVGVPYVGAILAPIAAATALLAGQNAIKDIKASSFNDQNAPSNPVSAPSSQRGINSAFLSGGFLAPQSTTPTIVAPEQPIQAYVLASDVTLGLQAYGQIGRRRRFG